MNRLILLIFISVTSFAITGFGATGFENESNQFKLQSYLRHNQLSEATSMLKALDKNSFIYNKYHGILKLKKENYKDSNRYLTKALEYKNAKTDKEDLLAMLAQNFLKMNQPHESLKFLEKIKTKSVQKSLLYSQALWDSDQKTKSLVYLQENAAAFKDNELLERQKYLLLFKSSMIKELFKSVNKYLENSKNPVEPALYAISLLKEKDSYLSEKLFDQLESMRAKNAVVLKERGAFELEKNRVHLASLYFSKAAHLDKKFSFEASVSALLSGNHFQALFFTENIDDEKKRVRQKFLVYVDQEEFELAISLKDRLKRIGLLEDEKLSYALLYSAYRLKDLKTFNEIFSNYQIKSKLTQIIKLKSMLENCEEKLVLECVFS